MTVTPSIDPARLLAEQLAQASPDPMRRMLQVFINTLLGAEADAVGAAAYRVRPACWESGSLHSAPAEPPSRRAAELPERL